jgi:spermidine synthase
MAQDTAKLTIDGKEYEIASLSDEAKSQIQNIKFAEAELQRLHALQAITQTALNNYKNALINNLPKD